MKNIHVIPTDKPILDGSINYILKCIKEFKIYNKQYKIGDILDELSWDFDSSYWKPQNIYITSNEEIKKGDYMLTPHQGVIKWEGDNKHLLKEYCKKVILTTDLDLIKDGIQAIDDEFLEWFVNNPSCEEVEVIRGLFNSKGEKVSIIDSWRYYSTCVWYKIIIPKEEILPEQIWNDEKMEGVKKLIQKQKLIEIIKSDEELGLYEETLEEAAERNHNEQRLNTYTPYSFNDAFKDGAKWQQEQDNKKWTNEEVYELLTKFHVVTDGTLKFQEQFFKQFKKK